MLSVACSSVCGASRLQCEALHICIQKFVRSYVIHYSIHVIKAESHLKCNVPGGREGGEEGEGLYCVSYIVNEVGNTFVSQVSGTPSVQLTGLMGVSEHCLNIM